MRIILLLLLLTGCFFSKDNFEIDGLEKLSSTDDKASSADPSKDPSFKSPGEDVQSNISALMIQDDEIILEGENLDVIDEVSVVPDEDESEEIAPLAPIFKLNIISKQKNKIIATPDQGNMALFFNEPYQIVYKENKKQKNRNFDFIIKRMEGKDGAFNREKFQGSLDLDGSRISKEGMEENQVLSFNGDKWTSEEITGQLEYLGAWNPKENIPDINKVELKNTLHSGQYFIISQECRPDSRIPCIRRVDGLTVFNKGDWMVFNGSKWQQINNRGKVFSFNNRKGIIVGCPDPDICPNTYDYTWEMINTSNAKLKDLNDVSVPRPDDNGKLLSWNAEENHWELTKDGLGIVKVTSAEIVNGTLTNVDFADGISIPMDRFYDLEEEIDLLVNIIPLNEKVLLKGNLTFLGSAGLTNIGEIKTPDGSFKIEILSGHLNSFDISSKLDKLGEVDANNKWYLSTTLDKVLTWKRLDSDHVVEGGANQYLTLDRVLNATLGNIEEQADVEIKSTDSIKMAFQRLQSRLEDEAEANNNISNIENGSITLDKLAVPGSGDSSGFLHFDSSAESWGLLSITGFNFLGEWDPVANSPSLEENRKFLPVDGAPNQFFNLGDFYLISQETDSGTLLGGDNKWQKGDWVVWAGENWKKINYTGRISELFGRTEFVEAIAGDYNWAMIEKNNDPSSLSDINDVANTIPDQGQVLKWNGSSWSFAIDQSTIEDGGVSGTALSNLTNIKFSSQADHAIEQEKVEGLKESLDGFLNKDAPQKMAGSIHFEEGSNIVGVNMFVASGDDPVSMTLQNITQAFDNAKISLQGKQPLLPSPGSAPNDSYFLAGNLQMKNLSTEYVVEGEDNLFMTSDRILQTVLTNVVENQEELGTEVQLGNSLNILQTKVNNRLTGVEIGTSDLEDESIKKSHLSVAGLPNEDNQFFHFNGSTWEIIAHSGSINYKGTFNSNAPPLVGDHTVGDYFIASNDSDDGAYKNGDWIIKSPSSAKWQQINAVSKVTSFIFGEDLGGIIAPKLNDYTLEKIDRTNSTVTSLEDISSLAPSEGDVLKWNNGIWAPGSDDRGLSKVTEYDISGRTLTRAHLDTSEKILLTALINFPFDDFLKKDPSGQSMAGNINFNNNQLSNVGLINGVNISEQNATYENFDNVKNDLELLLTFNGQPINFLNKNKEFVVVSHDKIQETAENKFYNSSSVFGTPLSGYQIAQAGTDHIINTTDSIQGSLGKLEKNLGNQSSGFSTTVFEYSNYNVTADNHLDVLVSSYSVYHLPNPKTISMGFTVTLKAQYGPIYIHPNYDPSLGKTYSDRPLIDGRNYLILAEPGAHAKLLFDGNNWNIVDSYGKYTFSVFKNDAPDNADCPYGFTPVSGNYLLETDGFCIQQTANQLSKDNAGTDVIQPFGALVIEDLPDGSGQHLKVKNKSFVIREKIYENEEIIEKGKNICENFKNVENMAGNIGIINKNQLLTVFHDSILATGDDLLSSANVTTFLSGFPSYVISHPDSHTLTNNGLTLSSGDQFFVSTYRHDYHKCTSGTASSCNNSSIYKHKGASNELIDWNSKSDGFSFINNSSCSNATNLTTPFSENFSTLFQTHATVTSSFNPDSFLYIAQKSNECDASYFDYFMGHQLNTNDYKVNLIYSDNPGDDRYIFDDAINGGNGDSLLLLSHDKSNSSTNKLMYHPYSVRMDLQNSDPKYMIFSRCFYIPDDYTCTLPSEINPRHVTTNCDTSNGPLSEKNCQITCADGYAFFPDTPPKATCTSKEGTFVLRGCYDPNIQLTKEQSAKVLIFDNVKGNVGYWRADKDKVSRDILGNVGDWTSYPDRTGAGTTTLTRDKDGPQYIVSNSDMNNNPSVYIPSSGGRLYNDSYSGLVNTDAFTRILITKIDTPSSASVPYFDGSTGVDGFFSGGDYYTYTNSATTQYARVDGISSDANSSKTMVAISTFDSSKTGNANQFKLRINATDYAFDFFKSNPLNPPGSGTGIGFGSNQSKQKPYRGSIAEVILFDRILTTNEIEIIESHLLRKYALINTCSLPETTDGHDVSNCNTSLENLSESECNVICDTNAGYNLHPLVPMTKRCSSPEGVFELSGCFNSSNLPTNAELANIIIANNNVGYWNVSNVGGDNEEGKITIGADGRVESWNSFQDKGGETTLLTRNSTTGPQVISARSDMGNQPVLEWSKNHREKLINNDFNGLSGATEFTRVSVIKPTTTSRMINYYDLASGWGPYFNAGTYYVRASKAGNQYGRIQTTGFTASLVDKPYIQVSSFDDAASDTNNNGTVDKEEKLKLRINGEDEEFTSWGSGTMVPPASANGMGVGAWTGDSYPWKGDLAEIILFDKKLSAGEISVLEEYLQKKYEIVKACFVAEGQEGYDLTNCDTSKEYLSQSQCQVTCDASAGYVVHDFIPITAICHSRNGIFELEGCFHNSNSSTSAQNASDLIEAKGVGHWTANNGIQLDDNNYISSWTSWSNKSGAKIVLTPTDPPNAEFLTTSAEMNDRSSVSFDGVSWLANNNDFSYLDGATEFTRVVIAMRSDATRSAPPIWDSSSSHEAWIDANDYSSRTSHGGSLAKVSSAKLDTAVPFLSLSTFDSAKSDGRDKKLVSRFNGEVINYTTYPAADLEDPASGTAINIGAFNNKIANSWKGKISEVIYDLKPEMSANEITNVLSKELQEKSYDFYLVNFANADMVGHTGNYDAAIKAIETLDQCIKQLKGICFQENIALIITADHGNSDCMEYPDGTPHTSHSNAPVPFCVAHPKLEESNIIQNEIGEFSLKDVAPTILHIMGEELPESFEGSPIFT